jgi:Zn-dependent peptidase ImmA (M78 family)/DNA-binding XRE family transcriptional regulator
MIKSKREFGGRIADARSAAGFTQGDLASKMGVDRTAITKIESGDRRVDSFELARIAEILRRPISWFLMSPVPNVISRRRERGGMEKAADVELELLAADVEQLVEMNLLEPASLGDPEVRVDSFEAAEDAALLVRERLGLPAEPIVDLVGQVERLGLYAFVLPLEANVEGAYVALADCGVALIQGGDPTGKRRFTLAHELGHHVLQDEYSTEWVTGSKDDRERLISAFAIHFLLPRTGVTGRWQALDGDAGAKNAAIHIAAEFGASWSALCSHLVHLDLISEEQRQDLVSSPPAGVDFYERGLFIQDVPPSRTLPPGFITAVARGYLRRLLGRHRALELLRGVVGDDDLPPQHDVPLDAMIGEFEPL